MHLPGTRGPSHGHVAVRLTGSPPGMGPSALKLESCDPRRPLADEITVSDMSPDSPGISPRPSESAARPAAPIRVFLLDDHEVVRRGVAALLQSEDDIEIVGEAGTADQALARIPALRPDVAVLDVRLPDGDGVTVCRELRSRMPELKVIMLTSYSDDEALFEAIMAGASGYLLKQILGQDLVTAVRTVAAGGS